METVIETPRGPLSLALALRDPYTGEHCGRVEALGVELATRMGFNSGALEVLRLAARLHDVGKIGVPDRVLHKAGPLDAGEWEVMKSHSDAGALICSRLAHADAHAIAQVVRHHHEAWDGSGYPDGLAGDHIPLGARIISVVDCFDAMTSDRPYSPARPTHVVLDIMQADRGRRLDPDVLGHFIRLLAEMPGA